jgi:hypothetical protein
MEDPRQHIFGAPALTFLAVRQGDMLTVRELDHSAPGTSLPAVRSRAAPGTSQVRSDLATLLRHAQRRAVR